ncbi:flavohemoglobin expression-modulating QEGLA motif protein [Thioalkalicoccus limnaeus]|uniref:Flavohemoglobin expression-modulating QEGLA motif protein n=1 Tax=Thioalkalicoccus limnaeus TaxID=120681 RepID=A0ABV4BF62_9GAMM
MMTMATEREKERIRTVARLLHQACRPMRILSAIAWAPEVKETFLAKGGRELPQPSYPMFDPGPTVEAVREARRYIVPVTTIDTWLDRQAQAIELGARMLAAVGTNAFFEYGRQLYGEPTAPLRYIPVTPQGLAQTVLDTIAQLTHIEIRTEPSTYHSAESVAERLADAVRIHFGDQAPTIELVDRLSANALATSKSIRVRRGARFTDRDFVQLLHHEAYIHVATSLNGREQSELPILAAGHPGTTRTQEGLAVFAELISGTIELDRLRRLADRVVAIQMAIDGADFIAVYQYFLERTWDPDQSFESARRVFRGGVVTGGAPFTKDVVYLMGLMQINYFVRACFAAGRADCLSLLFCGKLDLFDMPALCELYAMELCRPPRFLPPWVSDPRYLLGVLTFATFANSHDLSPLVAVASKLLDSAPLVRMPTPEPPPT